MLPLVLRVVYSVQCAVLYSRVLYSPSQVGPALTITESTAQLYNWLELNMTEETWPGDL